MNGLAERKIRPVFESLGADDFLKMRLETYEFRTVLKLIENDSNNFDYSYE